MACWPGESAGFPEHCRLGELISSEHVHCMILELLESGVVWEPLLQGHGKLNLIRPDLFCNKKWNLGIQLSLRGIVVTKRS